MKKERMPYIDNIRSMTVIIVMIYHAFYIFNGVGVLGGLPVSDGIFIFDSFCTLVYPWFMILLFCISGICARYSLERRQAKEFLKERACKLLIPSTIGVIAFHWIVGYINIRIGGGLEFIPDFLVYPISVLSGSGPLWFAHLAFLYSLIILWLHRLDKNDKLYNTFEKAGNQIILLILALLIWGSSQILNMPVITVYRFGIYFVSFLVGYFILSHEKTQDEIEKMLPITAVLSVAFGVIYMLKFNGSNFATDAVLKSFVTNAYAWFSVLCIIGLFKRYMNKHNKISRYISANSFAYYVLHYPVVLIFGCLVYYYCELPLFAVILLTLTLEFAITMPLAHLLKKIPIIRFVLLGIRGKKNEIQTDNRQGKG